MQGVVKQLFYHIKGELCMKVKVIGYSAIRSGEYQGRPYQNRKLSYVVNDADYNPKDYNGSQCDEITVPATIDFSNIKVGDTVNLLYNRWGKVESIVNLK